MKCYQKVPSLVYLQQSTYFTKFGHNLQISPLVQWYCAHSTFSTSGKLPESTINEVYQASYTIWTYQFQNSDP